MRGQWYQIHEFVPKHTTHDVTWSKKDSFCKDQYVNVQPEEKPTMQVKTFICQMNEPDRDPGFSKFDFSKGGEYA